MWLKRIIVSVLVAGAGMFASQTQTSSAPPASAPATQPAATQVQDPQREDFSGVWAEMERRLDARRRSRQDTPPSRLASTAEAPAPVAPRPADPEPASQPTSRPAVRPVSRPVAPDPGPAPIPDTPPATAVTPSAAPTAAPVAASTPATASAPASTPLAAPVAVASEPAKSVEVVRTEETVRLQYEEAPIGVVVRSFSDKIGRPLIGDFNVEGTITFYDSQPYTLTEAFDTINLLLAMRNYTMIKDGRFLRLMELSDATTLQVPIFRGSDPTIRDGELVTVLVPLKYLNTDEAFKMVVPMVSAYGKIAQLARNQGLLITDVMSNIRRIQGLLQMVDTVETTKDNRIEILELTNARAGDVADVIDNLWGVKGAPKEMKYDEARKREVPVAPDPKDYVRTTFDDRTNTLMILGEPGKVSLAVEMANRLDTHEGPADGNIRVFELKNAKADSLATTITQMFGPQGGNRRQPQADSAVRVVADAESNRLLVTAPVDKMSQIEDLIAKMDDSPPEGSGSRIFRLKHADANQLASIVTSATSTRDTRGRTVSSVTVSADSRSNILIVAGPAAGIETAATLITELDTEEAIEAMEVRVIHVETEDVRALAQSLLRVLSEDAPGLPDRRGRSLPQAAGGIRIEADRTSSNLIIAAPTADWPRIEKVLNDLQSATQTAQTTTRTFPLTAAKADEMALTLRQVLSSGGGRGGPSTGPQIQIAPSRQANALVVTATAEDHKRVAELVAQLDVAGDPVDPIVMIELKSADAEKVAATLQTMIPRAERGMQTVSITADADANAVLIRGPEAEREMLEQMIARLDTVTPPSARERRIHPLTHASASSLAPILTQMYAPSMSTSMSQNRRRPPSLFGGEEADRVIIAPAPGDKALVIDAPADKIEQIVQLIDSLDTETEQAGVLQPRSYTLTNADARQLAQSLGRLFTEQRQNRNEPSTSGPQPRFEAEQRTNTLLVTATAEQYETIEPMIKEVEGDGGIVEETKIFQLRYAKADDLVDVVREMLTGEQASQGGRRGLPPDLQGPKVYVAAMSRTNSLIVQGPPEKLALAEQLIANFDVEDGEKRTVIEVVTLENAEAGSLAESVMASLAQQPGGMGRFGRGPTPTRTDVVTVTAEPNSNSVLVRGPAKDVPEVIEMIRRLDGSGDSRTPQIRTYKLVNNDADEMESQLGQLFRDMIKQTPSPSGRGGRASQAPFTITADTRTNSLVVSTTASYFLMFEQLLNQLDQEVTTASPVHHIQLVNADAYDLAEQLRLMFRTRKGPEAPIIEADLWTNSMTIIAKDIDYKSMQPIIEQMDKVVDIQVRVINTSSLRAEQLAEQLQRMYPQVSDSDLLVVDEIPNRKGGGSGEGEIPPGIRPADDTPGAAAPAPGDTHGQVPPPAAGEPVRPQVLIAVDKMTNSLIVSGTRMELDNIEDLIWQLSHGAQSAEAEIRWYKIEHAAPESVAATLNLLFNPQAQARPQPQRNTNNTNNNNDNQQGGRTRPQQQQQQAPAPKPVITVATDVRTRHVIVRAKPSDLDMIDPIIKQLDTVTTVVSEVRTFQLKNTDATEVAANVREVLSLSSQPRRGPQGRGGQPTQARAEDVRQVFESIGPDGEQIQVDVTSMVGITANVATNSIVVSAPADAMTVVEGIIQELDQSAGASAKPVIRLYPVTTDDVAGVAQTLQAIFTQQTGGGGGPRGGGPRGQSRGVLEPPVVITADEAGKVLIVSASADQHELIAQVYKEVQAAQSQTGQAIVKVYKIRHADASQIANAIQTTIGGGGSSGGGGGRRNPRSPQSAGGALRITADTSSNSVVVATTAEQHERIAEIVTEMDTPPGGEGTVRAITLTQADAAETAKVLTRVFAVQRGGNQRGGAAESIVIEGNSRSKTLIVRADDETFTRIQAMAEQIDSAGETGTVHILPLTRGKAIDVAAKVTDLYQQQVQGARANGTTVPPLAVTADERANALILACTTEQFLQVSQWVNQLEEMSPPQSEPRIISLKYADPTEVEQAIRQLFGGSAPARQGGGQRGTLPFEMTVLPKQKQLLIDASDDDYQTILQLVATLDKAAESTKPEFKLFELKYADNTRVAQALTQMLTRVRQGARPEDAVTVTALPQTTAVVVAGTAERIAEAARLIEQLDTATVSPKVEFKIYPLQHAQPSKVIPLLDKMLAEYRKANPNEPVGLTADEATRSLIVTGRQTAFAEIEKILLGLDVSPEYPSTEVRVIPLLKADARSLATVLNDMLRPSTEGQVTPEARALQEQVRRLRVSGPAGGEKIPELDLTKPIKISSDPADGGGQGSNSLIIASTEENVQALAAIVAMMDTVPISEAVEVAMVQLEHADAASVLKVLEEIFTEGAKELSGRPNGPVSGKADPITQPGQGLVKPLNVSADPRTNTLILSGAPDTIALARKVITDLDREAGGIDTEVRLFKLVHADAARLADVLKAVFAEDNGDAAEEGLRTEVTTLVRPGPDGKDLVAQFAKTRSALTIEADESTNTLVVAARRDMLPLIADVIKSMDIPGAGSMVGARIVPLKFADASRMADIVKGLFSGPNANLIRAEDQPTVEIDPRTNSLIISTSDKSFDMIMTLIERLDNKTPIEMRDIRLIPLVNADAGALADTIQKMMDARVQRQEDLGLTDSEALRVVIIADARSNSLIVGGSPEAFDLVKDLAEQLDGASPALSGKIQIYPLTHANAGTLGAMLEDLFDKRYQAARTPDVERQKPIIIPDLRTNSLLVAANQDDSHILADLLVRLDVKPTDPAVRLVVIGLAHNDAGVVGPMLEEIFDARLKSMTAPGATASPQDQVDVSIDSLNNALIISASIENLDMIRELLTKVDVEPGAVTGIVRMYLLTNADAERIRGLLTDLIGDGLYKPGMAAAGSNAVMEAREKVSIVADVRTNVLIVSASKENFAVIEEIINRLDATDAFGALGDIRLFTLKHAEATKMADTLKDFFDSKRSAEEAAGGSGRALEITIVPNPRTNTLLVAGGRENIQAVEEMIRQLDTDGEPRGGTPQVFALRKAEAAQVVDTITTLYETQGGLEEAGVSISADERTNSIVVTGGAADVERIKQIIEKLDSDKVAQVNEIRVFLLKQADATELADLLTETLTNNPTGPTTSGGSRQPLMQFIRHLAGREIVSQALNEGVLVTPDTRSNALVVVASADAMNLLSNLIEALDSVPAPAAEIRIFRLTNADAREMADMLAELFDLDSSDDTTAASYTLTTPDATGRSSAATLTTGGADKASLTVTVDGRTNTLLIGGSEQYVAMAAKVIAELDSAPGQERVSVVYHLRNAKASDIEAAIRKWLDEEQQRTTKAMGDDAIAMHQQVEKEVSVVAVTSTVEIGGQTSERSNTLLISASSRHIDEILATINELDEPQPQVHIEVIMAEVTLDDTMELGVDWEGLARLNHAQQLLTAGTFLGTASSFGVAGSGLNLSVTGGDAQFFLQALHSQGRLEVLARPTITAIDNHEAEISIGQRVPFVTSTRVTDNGVFNTITYEKVGTILKVTPRISPDGFVLMEVAPEISSRSSSSVQISEGVSSSVFNERTASTTVSVRDGHTVVLGGLISSDDDDREMKLPFLGDLPYVGRLFKRTEHLTRRTEFLIMLTPRILNNAADATDMTRREIGRTHLAEGIQGLRNEPIIEPAGANTPSGTQIDIRGSSVIQVDGRQRASAGNVTVIGGRQ